MRDCGHSPTRDRRDGVAAAEFAVLMPFLVFVFLLGVDYARLFYHFVTITDCARNGALYGSIDSTHSQDGAGIQAAALAGATNLSPSPTVTSTTGNDASGNPYVEVTVSYQFQTIADFPTIPNTVNLARKVRMRVIPP
jgi:Flp pilus assembly protein TadG